MNIFLKKSISSFKKSALHSSFLTAVPVSKLSNFYRPEGQVQIHGRVKYDENHFIKDDISYQNKMIIEEEDRFENFLKEVEPFVQKYHKSSSQRKEMSQAPYPEKNGQYLYYSKWATHQDNDYEIIYRKVSKGSDSGELVLDMTKIPFLQKRQLLTCSMNKLALSDHQDILAFVIDPNNDENLVAGFRDLTTGKFFKDKLTNCANVVFSKNDPKLVYYVAHDDKKRTYAIKMHCLGESQDRDVTLFEEKNEAFYLDIKVSKDKEYFIIHSSSKSCNEILVMDRNGEAKSSSNLKTLITRDQRKRVFANHAQGQFFLVVSEEGIFDSKIVSLQDVDFKKNQVKWEDYYSPEPGELITEIDLFQNHVAIYLEKDGVSCIKIKDRVANTIDKVAMDDFIGKIDPGINDDYETDEFVFHFNNPFTYNHIFKYHISSKSLENVYASKLTGPPFKKEDYVLERISAPTQDGEEVPITLIRKKNLKLNNKNKVLMIGYGAYAQPLDVSFNIVNLSALENGWIIAYTHVRGGNEKGREWHQKGMGENKINSFRDFINSAEYLIAEGYTHPSLLCAYGSSAGGLLIVINQGGVLNMKPELFKAAILNVPFLDVLNALLDKNLPLTLTDHDEFGNPIQDEKIYETISSYCPYENISGREYPAILLSAGTLDYRCPTWSILKYLKRFRSRAKCPEKIDEFAPKNILLNVTESGHGGEIGTSLGIKEKALHFGFFDYVLFKASKDINVSRAMFV